MISALESGAPNETAADPGNLTTGSTPVTLGPREDA